MATTAQPQKERKKERKRGQVSSGLVCYSTVQRVESAVKAPLLYFVVEEVCVSVCFMEKSCDSTSNGAADSTLVTTTNSSNNNNNNTNKDVYLKHLNRISHKISKPMRRPPTPVFDQNNPENPAPPQPPPRVQPPNLGPGAQSQQQQQQHQPPVYNINKNDFRDVVQRLTGSPAHERFSTPPPIQPPKPPSSRLQRIRPPPLAQITNRPPPLPQISNPGSNMLNCPNPAGGGPPAAGFLGCIRQPLSPLPPFPGVHAAAESPISAYMRFLQSSVSSAPSPRWINLPQPAALHHLQQQNIPPPQQGFPQFPVLPPTSPLPFGCIPSPYPLLSPSLLFSPTGQLGFLQLPLSPSLPVPSPGSKGV